jgi:hypothetical protein
VPLATFVVEDMVELQQAHASYRFIILDEEEEKPRLLVRTSWNKSSCKLTMYIGLAVQALPTARVRSTDPVPDPEDGVRVVREDPLPGPRTAGFINRAGHVCLPRHM